MLTFRRAFRRRLRMPETGNVGRLGIVKTFALDQSRQLVVVRRDHVEHLVMIGGPNDLVIESDIAAIRLKSTRTGWARKRRKRSSSRRCALKLNSRRRFSPVQACSRWHCSPASPGQARGLICGFFRLALEEADRLRIAVPVWWHAQPLLGCSLLVVGAATAAAFSAWLVRRFSEYAVGSGIPHVEAAISGELPPAPFILLPVKFAGGLLAIGAGLALGREGPCVQMGATFAHLLGETFGRNTAVCRSLLAAGACQSCRRV
jgi:chloride channel protein, CIC family